MITARLDETRLRRLLDAGRGLVDVRDREAVLERVLETAFELTGARHAGLAVLDERREQVELMLTHGADDDRQALHDLPVGRTVLGLLIDKGRPLRLDDVSKHAVARGFADGHPQMRSFAGAPVLVHGEAWGTLHVTDKQEGSFTPADEDVVQVLAEWAAVALDSARLIERDAARRRELERTVGALEASASIARAVGGEPDVDRILELVVTRGRSLVHARAMLVLLREGDRLAVAAAAGELDCPAVGRTVAVQGAAVARVLGGASPLLVADVEATLGFSAADLGVHGARSALLVPLVYRALGVGVLVAFDRLIDGPAFSVDDKRLVHGFAASAAAAVAAARRAERERLRHSIESAERERRRWARELHDSTLQSLGALRLDLTRARRTHDLVKIEEAIETTIEGLGDEMTHLRTFITDLRPAALDDLGVPAALAALVARTTTLYHLAISLDVDLDFEAGRSDRRISSDIETPIYRIVQEALTNVGKHSGAASARVEVREHGGMVTITVTDDGHGFDTSVASDGFGMIGMQERAALARGRIEIESSPAGTTVTSRLPAREGDASPPASGAP